jgi:hypothetical protein
LSVPIYFVCKHVNSWISNPVINICEGIHHE